MSQQIQYQGEKIKEVIKNRGLVQMNFAEKSGWHRSSFSRRISEKKDFSPEELHQFARLLSVTPDFLANKAYIYSAEAELPEWAIDVDDPGDSLLMMVKHLANRVEALESMLDSQFAIVGELKKINDGLSTVDEIKKLLSEQKP